MRYYLGRSILFHDHFMDQMCVAVLQPDEIALDGVCFGALGCREIPTFNTLACDLAAYGFGDQFGEKHLSLISGVEAIIFVEVDPDGGRGRRNYDAGIDPVKIDTLARVGAVVEADVCEQASLFPQ